MKADQLSLPSAPHRPGSGSQPDRAPLEAAKQAAPPRFDPADWEQNLPYRYGWRLFEAGFYWEAHEVWECVWLAAPPNSRERLLLRSLIQFANAKLKQAMGQERAVARLAGELAGLLAEPGLRGAPVMGVSAAELSRLLNEIR